jgi:molecular chaperone DnaK
MRQEAETNAEEDRKRKELIEAKNHADNMVYTAEKTVKDLGDKVPADMKQKVEDAAAKVRDVKDGDDLEAIKSATDSLTEVLQKLGEAAYQQEQKEAPADPAEDKAAPDDTSGDDGGDDEDVVDGEFKQV